MIKIVKYSVLGPRVSFSPQSSRGLERPHLLAVTFGCNQVPGVLENLLHALGCVGIAFGEEDPGMEQWCALR